MDRIVYVNGEYLKEKEAKISVFDRGFLFADGVYEVSAVLRGRLVDNQQHLCRLRRSLAELEMASPCDDRAIEEIQKELIQRNDEDEGLVYLQITRGAADRDFVFPAKAEPSLILFTQKKNIIDVPVSQTGLKVITVEDLRWARRDIKNVSLLAASMAKMMAVRDGADDAWLVDRDGNITEGSSSNAYIVKEDGTVVTRHLSNEILHGITRRAVLRLAEVKDLVVVERPFSVEEAYGAREAFVTSAGVFVLPVVEIDKKSIGDGKPGPVATRLRNLYIDMALKSRD